MKTSQYIKQRNEQLKKDAQARKERAEKKKALTEKLINRYLEEYSVNDLIKLVIEVGNKNGDEADYFKRDEVIEELSSEGYKCIKVNNLKEEMQVESFFRQLFPYYNDQQTNILF